jgi:hypothetical protein
VPSQLVRTVPLVHPVLPRAQIWPISAYFLAKEATRSDFLIPCTGIELPFPTKKLFRNRCYMGGCGVPGTLRGTCVCLGSVKPELPCTCSLSMLTGAPGDPAGASDVTASACGSSEDSQSSARDTATPFRPSMLSRAGLEDVDGLGTGDFLTPIGDGLTG